MTFLILPPSLLILLCFILFFVLLNSSTGVRDICSFGLLHNSHCSIAQLCCGSSLSSGTSTIANARADQTLKTYVNIQNQVNSRRSKMHSILKQHSKVFFLCVQNYLSFSAVQNLTVHLLISTDSFWWTKKSMHMLQ